MTGALEAFLQVLPPQLVPPGQVRRDQFGLRAEAVVERLLRDAGRIGDPGDPDRGDPVGVEQRGRGREQATSGVGGRSSGVHGGEYTDRWVTFDQSKPIGIPVGVIMRAVLLTRFGGPDALEYRDDVPDPVPGPGEVRIRVRAAALNNTDIWTREGAYGSADDPDAVTGWRRTAFVFPRIQGADVAGEIDAVGDGVAPDRVGERVLVDPMIYDGGERALVETDYLGSERDGGFAELVTVPASNAHLVGGSLSFAELAALPTAATTAMRMLNRAGLRAGETVLVTGASGGVGSSAVQIAKARGATVVAVAGKAKHDALRELGADEVLDRDAAIPREVDVVADVVAGPSFGGLLAALAPLGRYVVAGAIAGPLVQTDLRTVYLRQLTLIGSSFGTHDDFAAVVELAGSGALRAPRGGPVPAGASRRRPGAVRVEGLRRQAGGRAVTLRALTFDVVGTLIDFEAGILDCVRRVAAPDAPPDEEILAAFGEEEGEQQRLTPQMPFGPMLDPISVRLAERLRLPALDGRGAASPLRRSVPDWPAFDDAPSALAALRRRYRLVASDQRGPGCDGGDDPHARRPVRRRGHRRGRRRQQAGPADVRVVPGPAERVRDRPRRGPARGAEPVPRHRRRAPARPRDLLGRTSPGPPRLRRHSRRRRSRNRTGTSARWPSWRRRSGTDGADRVGCPTSSPVGSLPGGADGSVPLVKQVASDPGDRPPVPVRSRRSCRPRLADEPAPLESHRAAGDLAVPRRSTTDHDRRRPCARERRWCHRR